MALLHAQSRIVLGIDETPGKAKVEAVVRLPIEPGLDNLVAPAGVEIRHKTEVLQALGAGLHRVVVRGIEVGPTLGVAVTGGKVDALPGFQTVVGRELVLATLRTLHARRRRVVVRHVGEHIGRLEVIGQRVIAPALDIVIGVGEAQRLLLVDAVTSIELHLELLVADRRIGDGAPWIAGD